MTAALAKLTNAQVRSILSEWGEDPVGVELLDIDRVLLALGYECDIEGTHRVYCHADGGQEWTFDASRNKLPVTVIQNLAVRLTEFMTLRDLR